MAMLERVSITPMALDTDKGSQEVSWVPVSRSKPVPKVPHIFFDDGEPWLAAPLDLDRPPLPAVEVQHQVDLHRPTGNGLLNG